MKKNWLVLFRVDNFEISFNIKTGGAYFFKCFKHESFFFINRMQSKRLDGPVIQQR